jgi:hypothetical protein
VVVVVVAQDARGVALGVVVLPVAKGPEERAQPEQAEPERDRDEDGEDGHLSLSALSETQIDDVDIASAAMIGLA